MSFFHAKRAFQNEIRISAAPSSVRALLSSAEQLIRCNPLVTKVAAVAGEPDMYRVTDRLRFLGIPYDVRYRARVRIFEDRIDSEAWASPALYLVGQIRFEPIPEGTLVRENVELSAPLLLVDLALRSAVPAHRVMLSRLKERVESERN